MSETQIPTKRRTLLYVNPHEKVPYIPRSYRDLPPAEQPKFYIRPLPHGVYEMRRDMITRRSDGGLDMAMGSWILLAVRHGLVGAEGPGTQPVTFEDGTDGKEVSPAYLDMMSADLRQEIGRAIETLCTAGPEALFA